MRKVYVFVLAVAAAILAGMALASPAEQYQAQAMGTGTEMGHNFPVTIMIDSYSTAEDQRLLKEAFDSGGSEALARALNKMPSHGRIKITGTVGYQVAFVRAWHTPDGTRIRLITDRPIDILEAIGQTRSREYDLSALELNLNSSGKGTGMLLPACEFKINKDHEVEIEAFQNPWKLVDVFRW